MGKRGTPCTVCTSEHRAAIEYALVVGRSLREIGRRFEVSWYAVGRHGRSHMPPQARAVILAAQRPEAVDVDAMREREASSLLASVLAQRVRLQQQAELALAAGDFRAATAAESGVGANLALTGKLLGQLVSRVDVRHAHLTVTPDYLRLRQILVHTLRPFPEAARAVAGALAVMEAEAATSITDAAAKRAPASKLIEHVPAVLPPCPVPAPPC